jgi:phage-related protein
MKPIIWCGDSRQRIRHFPAVARNEAGHQLNRVQFGHMPEDWKTMPTVGGGVCEVRIHADGEFRVLYVAKFVEAIYVLHTFQKKTRKTSKQDLELASERYRAVMIERRSLKR